jgi:DNA replication protein DnaC
MLRHPTLATLEALKLTGMATALTEQLEMPEVQRLSFEERLGLLVDRERTLQENRRLARRLATARLRLSATLEDLDYRTPRGLDKGVIASLATGQWIRSHDQVLITGPTGTGKTYLACALAQMACRLGFSALYLRLPRFFRDLAVAKGDGRYGRLLRSLAKTDLVLLDDWGLAPLTDEHRRDLLELLDDRHGRRATIVASQLPVDHWHAAIGEPTLADAILDRLVHNAYKITLKGESMRKRLAKSDGSRPPRTDH